LSRRSRRTGCGRVRYEDSLVKMIAGSRTLTKMVIVRCRPARVSDLDSRSGSDERSSQSSDERLSVPDRSIRHPMLNARKALGLTPFTDAPNLCGRSLGGDPLTLRARRPWIMMMRSVPSRVSQRDGSASDGGWFERGSGRDLAVLQVAPQGDGQAPRCLSLMLAPRSWTSAASLRPRQAAMGPTAGSQASDRLPWNLSFALTRRTDAM
jgi:hypothetical protein